MKQIVSKIIFVLVLYSISTASVQAFQFPIAELGNCRDNRECYYYCEIPQNQPACWSYSVYSVKENVLGETTVEEKLANLGITFPIAELGNCSDLTSCKQYCANPVNQNACHQYAQSHGLTKKQRLVEKAQPELGCNTLEECRNFCSQETNQNLCQNFAQKYHLRLNIRILQLAKEQLGCQNKLECKNFCLLEQNQAACQQFMQQNQLKNRIQEGLLEKAKEQLGCDSVIACKQFCQDPANRDKCRNFGQAVRTWGWGIIRQKIGCDTIEECRKVCQENPQQCPSYPKSGATPRSGNIFPQPSVPLPILNRKLNSATPAASSRSGSNQTNFQRGTNTTTESINQALELYNQ